MVRPLSTARPSTWWNTGVCVASSSSVRNTLPGHATYTGSSRSSSVRACTGDVCVRSTRPASRRVDEERVLHLPRRVVDAEVQRVEVEPLRLDLGALGDLPAHRDEDVARSAPRASPAGAGRRAGCRSAGSVTSTDSSTRTRASRSASSSRLALGERARQPALGLAEQLAGGRLVGRARGRRSRGWPARSGCGRPTCSRRAALRASRSVAAARASSASSTADSMPAASSGDRAVSSDILTFQCRFWAAGAGARPWPRREGARPADKSRGARSGSSAAGPATDGLLRCASAARPGNGPGKSATTSRRARAVMAAILPRPRLSSERKRLDALVQRSPAAPGARPRRRRGQLVDEPRGPSYTASARTSGRRRRPRRPGRARRAARRAGPGRDERRPRSAGCPGGPGRSSGAGGRAAGRPAEPPSRLPRLDAAAARPPAGSPGRRRPPPTGSGARRRPAPRSPSVVRLDAGRDLRQVRRRARRRAPSGTSP